jgi:hypothetical protein
MERFSGSFALGKAYPFANGIATSSNLQMIKGSAATSVAKVQNMNTKNFGVNNNAPKYPNKKNPTNAEVQVW